MFQLIICLQRADTHLKWVDLFYLLLKGRDEVGLLLDALGRLINSLRCFKAAS